MSEHVRNERVVQLLAAGFNAFGQLSPDHSDDIRCFSSILTLRGSESVRVLFSCWSSTVLLVGNRLVALGSQQFEQVLDDLTADSLKEAFGDHNGMIGCLDVAGRLYLIASDDGVHNGALQCASIASSPKISHVALTASGKIAVVLEEARTDPFFEIAEFETFANFMGWFHDPSRADLDPKKREYSIPGRPTRLLAGIATFLLLTESGEVYSWGDPRYRSLGRLTTGENTSPAESPAALESLGGLRISKIASGGWMGAALSEDRALYIWGTGTPGGDNSTIKPLREADAGETVLVEVTLPDGEPMDVVDVAVGDNHIVFIGENGDLCGIGSNRNGQLGLNSRAQYLGDWTLVQRPGGFEKLTCGPKCTFVLAADPHS